MKPAYHIALTAPERRSIAEIAAIQSQIEWLMRMTVQFLLKVEVDTAKSIMGSTRISNNAKIWIGIVREKHPDQNAIAWANRAYNEMGLLAEGRNDFLHGLFGIENPVALGSEKLSFLLGHTKTPVKKLQNRLAARVTNNKQVDLARIKSVRDHAAFLSCVFAHVEWTAHRLDFGPSPWRRKLGSQHRRYLRKQELQQGTRQKPPPQS